MKLEFIKNYKGCYNEFYEKGQVIDYHPWDFKWQGMTEKERVKKGVFVHCYGMGEFDKFGVEEVRPLE